MKFKLKYTKAETLIFVISIITIIMMLLLNMMIFRNYQNNLVALQEDHMETTVKAVSNSMENYYDDAITHFTLYFDGHEQEGALKTYCENQQAVSGAVFLDGQGTMVQGYGAAYHDYYPAAVARYQELKQEIGHGGAYLLPPVLTGDRHYTQFLVREVVRGWNKGGYVIATIEVDQVYQQIVQPVQIGENGYSMVKDFSGMILMHKARNQIGIDAVEGRRAQYREYNLQLDDLERWVQQQRDEETGSGLLNSYWWEDDKEPLETKKIVAYTQVPIGDEIWIINGTQDYDEIKNPLRNTQNMVFGVTAGVILVFGLMLLLIANSHSRSQAMEQEVKHLLEMNEAWEELHKREEQIRHNDKMKTLGTMTSMISHEFNNFLTPIMLYGELLAQDPQVSEENRNCLLEVLEAAGKARDLTRELSRYGRSDTHSARREFINVAAEIERSINMISRTMPTNIELRQRIEPDDGYGLYGNAGMVNQIVVNLCTNAIHAMRQQGGVLTVRGGLLREQDTLRYSITIEDTGHGMSETTQKQIFTPFYTTKESGVGTGLGLTVVQDLIHQVSGDIHVISEENRGTRFDILLPMSELPEMAKEVSGEAYFKDKSIFILDDNERGAKALEKGLRRECRKVRYETHPEQALSMIRKTLKEWDIIITDYAMPMINGLEFAGILRSLGYTGTILLLSGCLEQDVRWYLDNGIIQAALEKPVVVQDIENCLRS